MTTLKINLVSKNSSAQSYKISTNKTIATSNLTKSQKSKFTNSSILNTSMNSTLIIKTLWNKQYLNTNVTQSMYWTKYSKINPNKNSLTMRQFKKWTPLLEMMTRFSCKGGMPLKILASITWIINWLKIKQVIHIKSSLRLCTGSLQRWDSLLKGHSQLITSTLFLSTCLI